MRRGRETIGGAALGLLLCSGSVGASGVMRPVAQTTSYDLECGGRSAQLVIEERFAAETEAALASGGERPPGYPVALTRVVPLGGSSAVEPSSDVQAAFAKMQHVEKVWWGCGSGAGGILSLMITYNDRDRFTTYVSDGEDQSEEQRLYLEPFVAGFLVDERGIRLTDPGAPAGCECDRGAAGS